MTAMLPQTDVCIPILAVISGIQRRDAEHRQHVARLMTSVLWPPLG